LFAVYLVSTCGGEQRKLSGAINQSGYVDGNADTSRFRYPIGLALSADEKTLYVCDTGNQRIRAIDTASGNTCTLAGSGKPENVDGIGTAASIAAPQYCDWDRASDVEPFTHLCITASNTLRRLNCKTGQMTTIKCPEKIDPCGIACLSGSGRIVISCDRTRCLWTVDPRTSTIERLAGALAATGLSKPWKSQTAWEDPLSVEFYRLKGIAYHESNQSIWVADERAHTVFCVPLPDPVVQSVRISF
jgi:sugar lactone lactonase YvrE